MTQTVLLRLSVFCGLFSVILLIVDKRASALVVVVAGIVFLSLDLGMEDFWQHQTVVVRPRKQMTKPIWDRTQGAEHRSFTNDEQSSNATQTTETGGDTQSTYQTVHTQTVTTTPDVVTHLPDDRNYDEFVADHTGPLRGVGARPAPVCGAPGHDRFRRIEPVKTNQHYHSQTGRLSRYAWLS